MVSSASALDCVLFSRPVEQNRAVARNCSSADPAMWTAWHSRLLPELPRQRCGQAQCHAAMGRLVEYVNCRFRNGTRGLSQCFVHPKSAQQNSTRAQLSDAVSHSMVCCRCCGRSSLRFGYAPVIAGAAVRDSAGAFVTLCSCENRKRLPGGRPCTLFLSCVFGLSG